jgi:hypothetical protein
MPLTPEVLETLKQHLREMEQLERVEALQCRPSLFGCLMGRLQCLMNWSKGISGHALRRNGFLLALEIPILH